MNHPDISIRMAEPADAAALLAIYAPYVTDTAITFEYEVPSREEFARRIAHTLERFPYLVAEKKGALVGYAYASPFKERAAYDWAVETSIYLAMEERGQGTGFLLYQALEDILTRQNVLNVNACIAYPNPGSIRFHEKLGYLTAAHFTRCGFKLGQWWDMVWMEKMLGSHRVPPKPFIPVTELTDLPEPAYRPVRP